MDLIIFWGCIVFLFFVVRWWNSDLAPRRDQNSLYERRLRDGPCGRDPPRRGPPEF